MLTMSRIYGAWLGISYIIMIFRIKNFRNYLFQIKNYRI